MRVWAFGTLVRGGNFCGLFALSVLAGCTSGGGGNSTPTPPASIAVSVAPSSASLNQGGTQSFTATVTNDSASAGVTWSIGTGAGALSASTATGVTYTAPASITATATVTLTATSVTDKSKSATATITLNPPASTITSVAASCSPASVQTGATSQCSATVTGTGSYSSAVAWSVGGVQGGNSTVGTISSSGLYTAPSAVPATNPVTVTATSTQDTTKSGSANLTITSPASSVVSSFSPQSSLPGGTITITGSGFDPTEGPTVVFTEAGGLAVPVTPTAVTSTSITVTAPPFIVSSTGAFAAGSYSVSVNQSSGSSNSVAGLQIAALPAIPSAPGTLTLAFLKSTRNFLVNQVESSVQSASFDTGDLNVALASEAAALKTILPGIGGVVANPNSTYTIGVYAGQNVNVTSAALGQVDQMLLAMLAAQAGLPAVTGAAQPAVTSGGGCQSAAAAAVYNDVTSNANPNASQDVDAYYASLSASPCAAPQAITQGLGVVLGSAAVAMGVLAITLPADAVLAALALPTAAVLSVAALAAGGQIAIGGQLGAASAAGVQLVQNGVQEFEELLQTLLAKGSSLGILHLLGVNNPDSWLGLAGCIFGAHSVLNAFINGPPNNGGAAPTPFTLSVTTSGSGTGSVGSYPGVIACGAAGGACSGNFPSGAVVVLTAVPDPGFAFTGWSGSCAGTGDCSLVMNSNMTVDAAFGPPPGTVYTGTYSAPFQGTASDPAGGVYSATADFTFALTLVTNSDGTITGSADIPTNVNISVVSCPSNDTCTPNSFSVTVTGPISGSNGTISGNLSSGGSSPLTMNITGVISNGAIAITGGFSQTFEGQSSNAPPTYTTLNGTISGLTLNQQQ